MKYKHYVNDIAVDDFEYERIINKAIKFSVEFVIHTEHGANREYSDVHLDIPMRGLLDLIIYDGRISLNKANDNNKGH